MDYQRKPGEITVAEDRLLYGNAYTTKDGERLDPTRVWVTPGGKILYHTLDGIRSKVYEPEEINHEKRI